MSSLPPLFRWRKQPETVPTDRIVPLRYWDDKPYTRDFIFDFTLCFEDVLDGDQLRSALARLLEIGDWGQLGARIRLNRNNRLEYHIPQRYDASRTVFHFTTTGHGTTVQNHPLGILLPLHNDNPVQYVYPSPSELAPFLVHLQTPKSLDDWLYSDIPQLLIHAVVFHDATFLTITHLHTLFDGPSRGYFLNAWASVLAGREDRVFKPEHYAQHDYLLTGLSLALFFLRQLLTMLWYNYEEYQVRLPGRAVQHLRETALAEEPDTPGHFISENDVILSWATRAFTKALALKPARKVMVMNVMNVSSLAPAIAPDAVAYMGNAFFSASTLISAQDASTDASSSASASLAGLATRFRNSIVAHRTLDQVDAMAAYQRQSFMHAPLVVGTPDTHFIACTSYHCARFYETDFSPAVVPSSGVLKSPSTRVGYLPGRPVYINDSCRYPRVPRAEGLRVMGRDGNGDWWMLVMARSGVWSGLREELNALVKGIT